MTGKPEQASKLAVAPESAESRTKVTVVLYDRQIALLDHLAADIRTRTKIAISRAEIIRALIDALMESGFDATTALSETDLKAKLTAKLSE